MVHPYLDRRAGREPVSYPHPSLEPILDAHARRAAVPGTAAADRDGGGRLQRRPGRGTAAGHGLQAIRGADEADRGAACARAWREQGITGEAADDIVLSITSFALYGFPESHAASFALIVYASAYLKAHFPAAFYAALLNNQPMGFYHPATLVKDAQRHGVHFAPVDVQRSAWHCHDRGGRDGAARAALRHGAQGGGGAEDSWRLSADHGRRTGSGAAGSDTAQVASREPRAGRTVCRARL